MISGTSKISSKSGPVDFLIITKMLQKIRDKSGNILETYYLWKSETHFFEFFGSTVYPTFWTFEIMKFKDLKIWWYEDMKIWRLETMVFYFIFGWFILLWVNSWPYRLIHGILFGSELWRSFRGEKERRARTLGRGPGRSFWPRELLHEPRAESNAKNEPTRPLISRK